MAKKAPSDELGAERRTSMKGSKARYGIKTAERQVQIVPLQNLKIGFFEIEAARQHARDGAITLNVAPTVAEFDDAPPVVVFDGPFRLHDKGGGRFTAHGS